MTSVLASFFGALAGQIVGGALVWRYYLAPKFKDVGRALRAPRPAPASQAPAPAFTPHDGPVTVGRVGLGRVKKATRL